MINPIHDNLISRLTVRIRDENTEFVRGTGVLYCSDELRDHVYIITASHCLHEDGDAFQDILTSLEVDLYNPIQNTYISIKINHINKDLLFQDADRDIAIILLNKSEIQNKIGSIPTVRVVTTRQNKTEFIIKGFPNATMGKELDVIYPTWKQELTTTSQFQLQLHEDYNDFAIEGFSGSGIFINDNEYVYLFGIFVRFRPEDRGRVIHGQHIILINELLSKNFLPPVKFDYLGDNDINHSFFKNNLEKAIQNLGQRYSKKLNFTLPISKLFNDLARDKNFKQRFLQIIDKWLEENSNSIPKEGSELFEIKTEQHNLKEAVLKWVQSSPIDIPHSIEYSWITDEIERISELINAKLSKLYEIQREIIKANRDNKKPYNYITPYDREIDSLRELDAKNRRLEDDLQNKVNVQLTNHPVLIVKGEAGSGKSHLLGDIAQNRIDLQKPAILLLGQHFRSEVGSVDKNILSLLELDINMATFLSSLNKIGEQLNERIPILIDALNEGAGVSLWKDEVFGLINGITKYPFLGVVLSIRTTYFELMFPDGISSDISVINHEGFAGNEYAALKLFCDHYGLKQPDFPILAPEFTNPLFLILICKGVQNSSTKEFPQGFQGIGTIFSYYVKALEIRFKNLREEYLLAPNLISSAIQKFSLECFSMNESVMVLDDALKFFSSNFSQYPLLLYDMIQESVFIRNVHYNHQNRQKEEVIYFAYERFGDHFIANVLLKEFTNQNQVLHAFSKEESLGKLIDADLYKYAGILESLAIVLPEEHGLELFEVYSWFYNNVANDDFNFKNTNEWLSGFVLNSLKWRKIESINDDKLISWFEGEYFNVDYDEYLLTIETLSTIKNHPFNSNRLHQILIKIPMHIRDSFWQKHLLYYSRFDDDGIGYPIRRLLDWAWTPLISKSVDITTALLAAQSLTWVLSSTSRELRDEATKAIVNLLEQQPSSLIGLLEKFKEVDDMYIQERLYAIAYGCILRTELKDSIELIGHYVYNEIFSGDNPPEHILLRDYARNTVEYMIYMGVGSKIDVKKIRPPYRCKLPSYPSDEEISIYEIMDDTPELDSTKRRIYNRIHYSVMSGDFGRKVVEPVIEKFSPINFAQEPKYKKFINGLIKEQREHVNSLVEVIHTKEYWERRNNQYEIEKIGGQEVYEKRLTYYENAISIGYKILETLFNEQLEYVTDEIIPHLLALKRIKSSDYYIKTFNSTLVKRWIVKRAHSLGYDAKLHYEYDKFTENSHYRQYIERIGKKYQWIAFHEILSILADNHKLSDWYSDNNYEFYKGPWQFYARDIDPVYITRPSKDPIEDEMRLLQQESKWCDDQEYSFWNQENNEWARNIKDLPAVKHLISKTDENGIQWLFLNKFIQWRMPKPIGEDKNSIYTKQIWFMIKGYIIKKEDKNRIVYFLKDKSLWNRWMPESHDESNQLLNREKYWSPAYNSYERDDPWVEINYKHRSTGLFVMPAVQDAKAHISKDKSGAESSYYIPCWQLFNDLELIYSPNDGDFVNPKGDLVVQNIPKSGANAINKEILLEFLKLNGLDIIWTVLGEKMAYTTHGTQNYFGVPCGVFYMENGEIKGDLNYYDRH